MTDTKLAFVRLDQVQPAPRNPKDHDVGAIMQSLRRFGFVAPIIINTKTGNLVVGHGRVQALQQLQQENDPAPARVKVLKDGVWKVPCIEVAFDTDKEAEAYVLADNRLTELGGWNYNELAEVLTELGTELDGTGYDGDDVDDVLAMVGELPPPPGAAGPGSGESGDALWPTIKVRVPPEVFHLYRKVMAQVDGNTDAERFEGLVSLAENEL